MHGEPTTPPKMSVPLLLVICVLTCGIYVSIWFFTRRRWLNILTQDQKMGAGLPAAALTMQILSWLFVFLSVAVSMLIGDPGLGQLIGYAVNFTSFIGGIMILGAAFKVRGIIDWHYNYVREMGIPVSGLATFLFTVLYLQYVINRLPQPDMSRVE